MNLIHAKNGKFRVLLVDDNPGDVRLTVEAWKDAKVLVELHVAVDGVEALAAVFHPDAGLASPAERALRVA